MGDGDHGWGRGPCPVEALSIAQAMAKRPDFYFRRANDRLQWDGIWEDSVRVFHQENGDLYSLLDAACEAVGEPKLIICPWPAGLHLLARNQLDWDATSDGRLPESYPFHRDFEGERLHLMERGYLGLYRGAMVIASVFADFSFNEPYAVVASTGDASAIDYEGSNCVLVRLLP